MRPLASEILITGEEIREKVSELGRAIAADTPVHGEIAALVILKGAFVFAADLLREIPRRTRVGFMETHKDPHRPALTNFQFTHAFSIENSDLLVIEDILDSGVTMNRLLARLAARRPKRIRTVVLFDKVSQRTEEVQVEYRGFEIPNKWVVGYGLDDDEAYRNLDYLGYVE